MTKNIVKNHCNSCQQKTSHDIEGMHSERGDEHYHCLTEHAIVKCRGCGEVSFRRAFHDYESAYPTDHDEWEVPVDIESYPKASKGNIDTKYLPEVVESIYSETCNAYRDGALTLAGIGFRATIEAICNDQNIFGKELSTRINSLASKGLISKKDSVRLHSIRFMGNDAAHDIKKPSAKSLNAALIIVEHLLTTVYILDKEAAGKLDSMIEDYAKFEELLLKKLVEFTVGDEYPIQKFLGKDVRRISGATRSLEKQLDANIGKGQLTQLIFGKKAKFLESKEELQHYIVT